MTAQYTCGARTRGCRQCGHRYPKTEYDLMECPECGEPRACTQPVKIEGKKCRFHGGKTPGGLAAKNLTHGRYSKYLPMHLRERADELLASADVLSLIPNLNLLDVRLTELSQKVETREYGSGYLQLRDLHERASGAVDRKDMERFAALWIEMGDVIRTGVNDYTIWRDMLNVNNQRRQMVETIETIRVKGERAISIDDHLAVVEVLTSVFLRHVDDNTIRRKVADDIQSLQTGMVQ